jgi:hypothetical protein
MEYPGKVIARVRTADHQGGTLLPGALAADTLHELRNISVLHSSGERAQ